ncbi:DUF4430 domain-containing protein [Longirhabdus pacifica]|uniref:DUF4430 domain-containing protein n=1 Tax=Longirhabdus pacifica TaxID=2305227 RepID=UPI00100910F1|nr:DUF4430 domain-containing protein [Longirhabdus pacifica]
MLSMLSHRIWNKKIIAFATLFLLVVILIGCQTQVVEPSISISQTDEETPLETVLFSIVGPPDVGVIFEATEIEWQEDDTVLELLKRVTRQHEIPMEYRGSGAMAYIEGIDNIYEFDRGSGSGWMYAINGKFPNRSAGIWPTTPNDEIEWLYTEDLGEDIGAALDGLWDGKEE